MFPPTSPPDVECRVERTRRSRAFAKEKCDRYVTSITMTIFIYFPLQMVHCPLRACVSFEFCDLNWMCFLTKSSPSKPHWNTWLQFPLTASTRVWIAYRCCKQDPRFCKSPDLTWQSLLQLLPGRHLLHAEFKRTNKFECNAAESTTRRWHTKSPLPMQEVPMNLLNSCHWVYATAHISEMWDCALVNLVVWPSLSIHPVLCHHLPSLFFFLRLLIRPCLKSQLESIQNHPTPLSPPSYLHLSIWC